LTVVALLVALTLDYRKKLILNTLLKAKDYLTSRELAAITGVSSRTIRNDIKIISEELDAIKLSFQASPGLGYKIPDESHEILREELSGSQHIRPVTPEERRLYILHCLFDGSVTLAKLLDIIFVSESTMEKDIEKCSIWFEVNGMELVRKKNILSLAGPEENFKKALVVYYSDLSQMTGLKIETLLENEYESFLSSRERIQAYINKNSIKMNDDEYTIILILMTRFSACRANAESDTAFCDDYLDELISTYFIKEELYQKYKETVREILRKLNKKPGALEYDDELLDSLCYVLYSPVSSLVTSISSVPPLHSFEKEYPEAFVLSVKLIELLDNATEIGAGEGSLVRVGMCFAAFIERTIMWRKKKAAVICEIGSGTSQLLSSKLGRFFPNIELSGFFPLYKLGEAEKLSPDFLISTVDIETDIDVARISPFLGYDDFDNIVSLMTRNSRGRELFRSLSSPELFFRNLSAATAQEAIQRLCKLSFGEEHSDFEQRVLEREKLGPTSIGNLTAIPHAVRNSGDVNTITIGTFQKPIKWGKENVRIVILLRIDDPEIDLASVFDFIYSFISSKNATRKLADRGDYSLLFD